MMAPGAAGMPPAAAGGGAPRDAGVSTREGLESSSLVLLEDEIYDSGVYRRLVSQPQKGVWSISPC